MALIRIENTEEGRKFAHALALNTGAQVYERPNVIVIEGEEQGDLVVYRWIFESTLGKDGGEGAERAWRSLVLYREGDAEVNPNVIVVRNPVERKRGYLLEFDDIEEKDRVMAMADKLGYESTRAFVLDAVRKEMEAWEEIG